MTEKEWRTKIEKKGNKNKIVTCMLIQIQLYQ